MIDKPPKEAPWPNEEKFSNLFHHSNDGIFLHDDEGNIIDVNQKVIEQFGYSRAEILTLKIIDLHPLDMLPSTGMAHKKLLQAGWVNFEIEFQRKNGARFPAEVSASRFEIDGQTVVQGIVRDITERKQAETAIKQSEARYRLLLAASADPIAIYDLEGRTTYVNPAFERIFGWSMAELVGRRLDFVPDEKKAQLLEIIQQTLKEGKVEAFETQRLTKSGQKLDVAVSGALFQDEQGQSLGSFAIIRDISQQKKAEKAIKQQNEYLAALHETTLGLMSRLEVSDLLEALIVRAGQLLGTPHGFIYLVEAGGTVLERKVGVGCFAEYIGDRLKPGEGLAGQVWQTGQPLTVADYDAWPGRAAHLAYNLIGTAVGVPLTQHTNTDIQATEVIGVIGLASEVTSPQTFGKDEIELLSRFAQLASIALDNARLYTAAQQEIAEHKLTQAALEKAKEAAEAANRYKSTFLANMSHELRTPLNAIIGYSEMLQEEAAETEQIEFIPDLNKINTAGKHLLTLIDDILDLSKIEAGKVELFLETFDIEAALKDIVDTIQPLVEKNQNILTVKVDPDLGTMSADLTKVRQAVFNLLSNACKFTNQGQITLTVERQRGDPTDTVIFVVTDTGIGMSFTQTERLFQEFTQADTSTTRKYGGTGLGLAISRRFCEMMGGDISVKSEVGRGSTFTIRLPAEVLDPKAIATLSPAGINLAGHEGFWSTSGDTNKTVLVIDDDPTARDLLQRFLSKEGFRVITAADGETGLQAAKQFQPIAITLDVMMPGLDGWSVLTRLKADPELADIPVIMLTIVSDKNMGYALGASDYLLKPIKRERLITLLEKYRCPPASCQVLIVEDDEPTRELVRRMLEKAGWQVAEAENGRVALAYLGENRPELILLDLMMPEMDGFQFVNEVRQRPEWAAIPIVIVTAMDLSPEERKQLNGSVQHILQKGRYTRDALLQEVYHLVLACVQPELETK